MRRRVELLCWAILTLIAINCMASANVMEDWSTLRSQPDQERLIGTWRLWLGPHVFRTEYDLPGVDPVVELREDGSFSICGYPRGFFGQQLPTPDDEFDRAFIDAEGTWSADESGGTPEEPGYWFLELEFPESTGLPQTSFRLVSEHEVVMFSSAIPLPGDPDMWPRMFFARDGDAFDDEARPPRIVGTWQRTASDEADPPESGSTRSIREMVLSADGLARITTESGELAAEYETGVNDGSRRLDLFNFESGPWMSQYLAGRIWVDERGRLHADFEPNGVAADSTEPDELVRPAGFRDASTIILERP